MKIEQKRLSITLLDKKMAGFRALQNHPPPSGGWINAIRTALGMSLQQLGKRLNLTPQGVKDIERREKDGAITLQRLKEVAAALDMQLVYGFVPKEESLEKIIEKRAKELARQIVLKTSHTMHLENQGLNEDALDKAIERRMEKIKNEMPKDLWN